MASVVVVGPNGEGVHRGLEIRRMTLLIRVENLKSCEEARIRCEKKERIVNNVIENGVRCCSVKEVMES